jgi:hypothetical protein
MCFYDQVLETLDHTITYMIRICILFVLFVFHFPFLFLLVWECVCVHVIVYRAYFLQEKSNIIKCIIISSLMKKSYKKKKWSVTSLNITTTTLWVCVLFLYVYNSNIRLVNIILFFCLDIDRWNIKNVFYI